MFDGQMTIEMVNEPRGCVRRSPRIKHIVSHLIDDNDSLASIPVRCDLFGSPLPSITVSTKTQPLGGGCLLEALRQYV